MLKYGECPFYNPDDKERINCARCSMTECPYYFENVIVPIIKQFIKECKEGD